MRIQASALIGAVALFGGLCVPLRQLSRPRPTPSPIVLDAGVVALEPDAQDAPAVASSAPADAAPESPCAVMRDKADWTRQSEGHSSHLAERPIEDAIRRYYARHVLAGGIDQRSFARHPVVFRRQGTAPGGLVERCIEEWRASDPDRVVSGGAGRFAADHPHVEVTFEFNDASDGENAYTAFVDLTTMRVAAMFHYNNFQP